MHETHGDTKAPHPQRNEPGERGGEKVPVVLASHLLGVGGIVHIEHAGELYTLRRTRNGRLLLTK